MSDHISEGIRWDAGMATGRLGLAKSLLEWLGQRPDLDTSIHLVADLSKYLNATVQEESGFLHGSE